MILILASQMLSAASDSASFDISAYHIAPESAKPSSNSVYIEIGDTVSGGILDSAAGIDLTNYIDGMLTDFNANGTVNESGHPEEIVFSYLLHGYGLPDGTDMRDDNHEQYTLSVSVSPFTLINGNSEILSSFRVLNTTSAFDDGSKRLENPGVCNNWAIWDLGEREISYVDITDSIDSSSHQYSSSVVKHSIKLDYDRCSYGALASHSFERKKSLEWTARGAVSIVFDRESYENAPNGTYTSNVTLTLTSN